MKWTPLVIAIALAGCSKDDPATEPKPTAEAPGTDPAPEHDAAAAPAALSWHEDEPRAVAAARAADKPLFIDISATWCAPCMELEKKTFPAPAVAKRLAANYVLLRIDVTDQTDESERLQNKYDAEVLPVLLVVSPDGEELGRINQFVSPDELLSALDGF